MAEAPRRERSGERKDTRVDFTPMVDMMMLLLTFFMFVTTLSKPQIMDIAMPSDPKDLEKEKQDQVPESQTITLILAKDHKIFYYEGKPDYTDFASLKETSFDETGGLRDILLNKNKGAVEKMIELKRERVKDSRMSRDTFVARQNRIKGHKDAAIAVIKPMDDSVYADLVNALDEMAICSIGKYAIVKFDDTDEFLMKNLETKGQWAAEHEH